MDKSNSRQTKAFEFHIAQSIRKKYQMNALLFATDGHVVFADYSMVRQFVFNVNQGRTPDQHLYPGEVNAAALLSEIYHLLLRRYEEYSNPGVFTRMREQFMDDEYAREFRALMLDFVEKFPPFPVYQQKESALQYLEGRSGKRTNLEITMEEVMMLYFANINPANKKMREFFNEEHLEKPSIYHKFIARLEHFFGREAGFGPDDQNIFSLLRAPIQAAPNDLNAQLQFIFSHWKSYLPETITIKLLGGLDLMKEDVSLEHSFEGPPPTQAPVYKKQAAEAGDFSMGKSGFNYFLEVSREYEEYEQFTDDIHWMPRVVMMAKNTWVWLDQLSRKYQREIRRLDQVPDQELDILAGWNINGLWLIGIWERSSASKRIKHIMGNIDAVSSAYSLYDYEIAADLGGEEAFQDLNHRARQRGIRLAGDMVPNHTGIFSKWILEHPDYFIQAKQPPFPGYQFTGENLSPDPRIQIHLEDGYYSKQDAAVVFRRTDNHTGDQRFIYHGNDGTMMPWNDTAQLDFLKQEVREAVIQKIFEVARKFSIIRFDAAMTLAKKHFARLWYPRPGTGGDIASRADYAMSQSAFDEMFPVEFWREVVDRMNREMPDTLLLAEAFWFMEGYFVRTLGMHRVYNSAFMHMLKNEENAKYRDLITNTLEFEPEILKRYVNFMSNPDEETAIRQFGTGDKYFGICVLMNTLPGLPMFGHGQVEGYTEKYGMEYQRAYYNEFPNQWLIDKHVSEIFPLTAKRYIFSEVEHFHFFDFLDDHGNINENVMAYTNRHGNEKALILFNNKYETATGRIRISVPKLNKSNEGTGSCKLSEALQIDSRNKMYYILREHISGLEYLYRGKELDQQGFHWSLQGFEYRIFMDFRELCDESGELRKLHKTLGGRGVPDMDTALAEMQLRPVHEAFERIFEDACIEGLIRRIIYHEPKKGADYEYGPAQMRFELFTKTLQKEKNISIPGAMTRFRANLKAVEEAMDYLDSSHKALNGLLEKHQVPSLDALLIAGSKSTYRENIILLLAHYSMQALSEELKGQANPVEDLKLHWALQRALKKTGHGPFGISRESALIRLLSLPEAKTLFHFPQRTGFPSAGLPLHEKLPQWSQNNNRKLIKLLETEMARDFLGMNLYKDVWYYSREHFEELLQWLFSITFFDFFRQPAPFQDLELQDLVILSVKYYLQLSEVSNKSDYKVKNLQQTLGR